MKTLFLFFCLSGLFSSLCAQNELADLKSAAKRAEQAGIDDSIAQAYCRLGEYYAYRSSDTARYWFEKSMEATKYKRPPLYTGLLVNLAETYFSNGDMDEAMKRYQFSRDESARLKDTASWANSISSIGIIYRRKEMPDSALICYNQALQLLEHRDADWDQKANLLGNISILYANTSRLDEGLVYGKRAVEAAEKCGDMDMILYANYSCGSILFLQGKYDEGIAMIRAVLEEGRKQRMPKYALKGIVTMLRMFYKIDQRDSVNYYMREAEVVLQELPANSVEVLGYREMQSLLLSQMGRYKESLEIQKSLLKYQGANAASPVDKLYLEMARNYQDLKDYSQAAKHYERAYALADSLRTEQVQEELSELTVKYETKEKELEIVRLNQMHLEQEAQTMRWAILALIFAFAFIIFTLYYIFRRKRMQKEQEYKLAQRYIEGLEKERTRLAKELHDGVCNDLLGIGMQMQYMESTPEARQEMLRLLEQVRGDVRCISHELMPPKFQYVTLAEAIEAYVGHLTAPSAMRISMNNANTNADWKQIPEQIAYEVYRVAQELLSNSVKHSGATILQLDLSIEHSHLLLRLTDNGKGYAGISASSRGIGLNTIRERAKSINATLAMDIKESGIQEFLLSVPLPLLGR